MIRTSEIIRLTPSQIGQVSEVLARAFHDDPMMTYIIPEEAKRPHLSSWFFSTGFCYGWLYGEVYTTSAVNGAAIMLAAPLKFGLAGFGRFMNIMDYAEKAHKQAVSGLHWYLLGLGVEPSRQGQGLGGALIQPILARADVEGLPCYLETMNEKTCRSTRSTASK